MTAFDPSPVYGRGIGNSSFRPARATARCRCGRIPALRAATAPWCRRWPGPRSTFAGSSACRLPSAGVWQRRSGTFSCRSRGDPVEYIRLSPRNAGPVQLSFYPVALRLTGNLIANLRLAPSLAAWDTIRRRRLLGPRRIEKPARGFVVTIGEGAVEAPGHGLRDRPATSALAIKSKLGR